MIRVTDVASNSGASWVNALNGKIAKVEAASYNTQVQIRIWNDGPHIEDRKLEQLFPK